MSGFANFLKARLRQLADPRPVQKAPSPVVEGRAMAAAVKRFINARLSLALAEVSELGARLKPLVAMVAIAIVLAVLLLLTVEAAVLGALVFYLDWHWFLSALVMAGAHLLLLVIVGLLIRHHLSRLQPFKYSRNLSDAEAREAKAFHKTKEEAEWSDLAKDA